MNLDGGENLSLFSLISNRNVTFPFIRSRVVLGAPKTLSPIRITNVFISHYSLRDVSIRHVPLELLQN